MLILKKNFVIKISQLRGPQQKPIEIKELISVTKNGIKVKIV